MHEKRPQGPSNGERDNLMTSNKAKSLPEEEGDMKSKQNISLSQDRVREKSPPSKDRVESPRDLHEPEKAI